MAEEERPVDAQSPAVEPTDSHSPADEQPENQPQNSTQETHACTAQEEPSPSRDRCSVTLPREKGAEWPPHPLWRGWWLAVILLGCIVVLGQEPPHLSDWLNPPLRPFAGGILLGCALGCLPRVLRRKPAPAVPLETPPDVPAEEANSLEEGGSE